MKLGNDKIWFISDVMNEKFDIVRYMHINYATTDYVSNLVF